uniref:Zgc:113232 n=1 Tax=Sinocyclocheilus grahami TaxID=75366 RepID=A0A672LGS0_SINGR
CCFTFKWLISIRLSIAACFQSSSENLHLPQLHLYRSAMGYFICYLCSSSFDPYVPAATVVTMITEETYPYATAVESFDYVKEDKTLITQVPYGGDAELGLEGPTECDCEAGEPGFGGFAGPKGSKGLQGKQGFPGVQGRDGYKGTKGVRGRGGDTGPEGSSGPDGEDGASGFSGAIGLPGLPGDPGETGQPGLKVMVSSKKLEKCGSWFTSRGPQGDSGDAGAPGKPGPKGLAGPAVQYVGIYCEQILQLCQGVVTAQISQYASSIRAKCQERQALKERRGPQGMKGVEGQKGLSVCFSKGAKGLKGQRGEPVIGLPGHDGHQDLRGLPSHPAEPKDGIDGLRGPCGFPRPVDQPGMVGDAGIPGMCEARDCSIHAPVVRKEMGLVKGPLS